MLGQISLGDLVSVKLDAARERVWRKLNRPHSALRMPSVINGLLRFAESFSKDLVTETMLVKGVNDETGQLQELAGSVSGKSSTLLLGPPYTAAGRSLGPASHPGRPVEGYALLVAKLPAVECLQPVRNEHFASTGSADQDLLGITAVHPMEQTAVEEFLRKAGADWTVIERLLENGQIIETGFQGRRFYRKAAADRS